MANRRAGRATATDPEDPAVVAAARAGDRAALTLVFEAYKEKIAHLIFRMTGDYGAVDDLVQEVFMSAFFAFPRFRGESLIRTWLYTIAVNRVRKWWDAQRIRHRKEARARDLHVVELVDSPHADLEAKLHQERLYAALEQLPDSFREAFMTRAVEGLELREASAVLQSPISTVSWRARRAEAMLCELLGLPAPRDE